MLVLDFRDDAAGPELVRSVRDTLVVHLSKQAGLTVLSSEDLRRVADLEAQKQSVGCDEQSCLAELAGAVGAELVVFGNVARLGDLIQININVLDVAKAAMRGRESVEVSSPAAAPQRVRAAVDALFGVARDNVAATVVASVGYGLVGLGAFGVGSGIVTTLVDGAIITGTNGRGGDALEKSEARERYTALDPALTAAGVVVLVAGGALVAAGWALE